MGKTFGTEGLKALGGSLEGGDCAFLHGLVCCVNTAGSEKALNVTTDRRISNISVSSEFEKAIQSI
jgi:hypothetical protein